MYFLSEKIVKLFFLLYFFLPFRTFEFFVHPYHIFEVIKAENPGAFRYNEHRKIVHLQIYACSQSNFTPCL